MAQFSQSARRCAARAGKLKLDELVTRRYALAQVNEAFADMVAGVNARGVIVF